LSITHPIRTQHTTRRIRAWQLSRPANVADLHPVNHPDTQFVKRTNAKHFNITNIVNPHQKMTSVVLGLGPRTSQTPP